MHWVFVAARGLSLIAASRGYSVVVLRLLIAVASLVEHRLPARGLQYLWLMGSRTRALERRLSSCGTGV